MAKGERRRRRLLEQDGSSAEPGSEAQASEAVTPGPFGGQQPASETSVASAPERTSEQQPEGTSETDAAPSAPRPIALAEILAKPRTVPREPGPRRQRASLARTEAEEEVKAQSQPPLTSRPASADEQPARDPFFAAPAERFAA